MRVLRGLESGQVVRVFDLIEVSVVAGRTATQRVDGPAENLSQGLEGRDAGGYDGNVTFEPGKDL